MKKKENDEIRITPDALISLVVTEAEERELASMPSLKEMNAQFHPSEQFQKKMDRLLKKAHRKEGWVQIWKPTKKVLIAFTSVMTALTFALLPVQAFQDAVVDTLIQWRDGFMNIVYSQETDPIDSDTFTVTGGRTETFVNEDGQEQETIHPLPFEDMVLQYDGSLVTQWGEGIAADQAGYYASDGEKLYYVDFETNECRSLDGAGQIDSYGVLATIKGSSFCRNGIFYYVDDQGIVAYDTTNNSESRILTDTLAPFLQDDVSCVTLIVTDHQAIAVAADLNSETQTVYRYEI